MKQGDLKSYGKVIQRRLPAILLISIVAALIAYGIGSRLQPKYIVHFSYMISLSQRDTTPDFRFDGFYALQATDLFAATLAAWLNTPEQVVAAYRQADLELPSSDAREVVKAVEALKAGPQLVQVAVKDEDKARAEKLARGLQAVAARQVAAYHDKGAPAIAFTVVSDSPWTSRQQWPLKVVTLGTFVFVFLFLINGVLLLESVKRL